MSTYTDPTDKFVRLQKKAYTENKVLDFNQNDFEFFCDLCQAYVKKSTKHCKRCNRCVNDFDHHCKWVNNCIGKQNYGIFISMLVALLLYLAYAIAVISLVISRHDALETHEQVIFWITFVIDIVGEMLNLNLMLFHIWLIKNGLTTFQYIVMSLNKNKVFHQGNLDGKILRSSEAENGNEKKESLNYIGSAKQPSSEEENQTNKGSKRSSQKFKIVKKIKFPDQTQQTFNDEEEGNTNLRNNNPAVKSSLRVLASQNNISKFARNPSSTSSKRVSDLRRSEK